MAQRTFSGLDYTRRNTGLEKKSKPAVSSMPLCPNLFADCRNEETFNTNESYFSGQVFLPRNAIPQKNAAAWLLPISVMLRTTPGPICMSSRPFFKQKLLTCWKTALVLVDFVFWFYATTIILSIYSPLDTAVINF
jgi:hypothetical protein